MIPATRVMLDLETFGTSPNSVIVALGAVKFARGTITGTFYERIDAQSCVDLGLEMDVSTVAWWMKQEDSARLEIVQPGKDLSAVLIWFAEWLDDPDAEIWGNGAAFDNVLLANAYRKASITPPWKYRNDRCYRTLGALHPEIPRPSCVGTPHHALADAETQALHLMSILNLHPSC